MKRSYLLMALISSFSLMASAGPVAFPGAEGSGRFAVGGRGGGVYEVTNLNNSGPGSIVDAVSAGNRTIVFRISGTIELGDVILRPKSYTTIAGQTAPGDGICLKGRIYIGSVTDVVIRYLRVRVDEGGANSSGDAIDIAGGNNIIIDHVSASYARDETISCQDGSNHVTVQWCILSEALTFEGHSYGSLIRGEYGEQKTYHHNLYAHNNGRNPRPGNYTSASGDPEGLHFDFRNNVMYNWKGSTPGYNADTSSVSRYNFIGNICIAGPESSISNQMFKEDSKVAYAYWSGNAYGSSYATVAVPADQWSLVRFNGFTSAEIAAYKARSYLVPMEPVTTTAAAQALQDVLAGAGAGFPARDIIDTRIVSDVINRTGHSIAATADQPEGAWPPLNSLPAPVDGDHDGMPDAWESAHGLNPAVAADRNDYTLHAEYTNLEVYLNGIVEGDMDAPAAPTGLVAAAGESVVSLDWNDNTEVDLGGYNVYRSTTAGSGYVKLNASLLTSSDYTDNTVDNGTTYYYIVTAVDTSSNESAASDEAAAMPRDVTPPSVPSGLWASIVNAAVVLDWLDNVEEDFDTYNVYRAVLPAGDYVRLTPAGTAASTWTDSTGVVGSRYAYAVTAVDIYGNESGASFEVAAMLSDTGMGKLLCEWWTDVAGSSVAALTAHAGYPDHPSGRLILSCLEGPTNWGDAYGTRLRGFLHPPAGGSYTFWIAGDNECQLFLSSDGTPENADLIASITGSTAPRQWDLSPSQQSASIELEGGRKYYIEVLHKEDTGGDHVAVAWACPGLPRQVVAGQYLSPWFVGLYGDTNADEWVDLADLPAFVEMWLESDCAASSAWDLNGDCVVNLAEYAELAWNWMADSLPPAAPANLTLSSGDGFVSLDWDDNAESDLTGYNVYRSTIPGGGYTKLNPVPAAASDYLDESAINGTAYYYVVTAVDSASNESGFSDERSARPNAPLADITIQEYETGFCDYDGIIETEHAGYTGSGYTNTDNAAGNGIVYRIEILAGGTYAFVFRYASTSSRPANLIINGVTQAGGISFPATGAWTNWSTASAVPVVLAAGTQDIRIEAASGDGLGNIDYMQVTGPALLPAECP